MQSKSTILAVGATGKFAGLVVPALAKRGAQVRALIRDEKQADEVRAHGASEIALGDLTDGASIERALDGVGSVFYIAPAFLPDEARVGQRVVDAASKAGVRRFVFSSVIHPVIAALDNHIAKAPVEEAILESGMEYVFLQPTLFFQNFEEAWAKAKELGVYGEPWSAQTRFSRVDFRDVAEVAAIALTEDRLNFGTYELCAEGALNRIEVAALMSEVLGRAVQSGDIDPSQASGPPPIQKMFAWYDRRGLRGNALILRAILGREPRTLCAYLEELAAHSPAS